MNGVLKYLAERHVADKSDSEGTIDVKRFKDSYNGWNCLTPDDRWTCRGGDRDQDRLLDFLCENALAIKYDFEKFVRNGSFCDEMMLTCVLRGQLERLTFFLQNGFPLKHSILSRCYLYGRDEDQMAAVTCHVMHKMISTPYQERAREMLETFRLYMAAVPHSFTTLEQLRNFARKSFAASEEDMRKMCEMYQNHFPETAEGPVVPRSLKHLSRVAFRKRFLFEKSSDALNRLNYPLKLRKYLTLEHLY